MARIDERTDQLLQGLSRELAERLGEGLVSVILYGSAAGPHYLPGISDLNLLVVLTEATPARLRESGSCLRRYRKAPIDAIFLDRYDVAALGEAFPLEATELLDQRRMLYGEDVLQGVEVSPEALRLQLISELIGKAIHLRAVLLEPGRRGRRLEEALQRAISPFEVLMRALLRLGGAYALTSEPPPPREFLEVLTQLEERFGLELGGFREAYQVKAGRERPVGPEAEALFRQVLRDAATLVRRAPEIAGGGEKR